jgi:hypothetical protein
MRNKPHFSQILQFIIQSGDNKAFIATFEATERMWLDTTGLLGSAKRKKLRNFDERKIFQCRPYHIKA